MKTGFKATWQRACGVTVTAWIVVLAGCGGGGSSGPVDGITDPITNYGATPTASTGPVSAPVNASPGDPTITLSSDPGDGIGLGKRYAYNSAVAKITVTFTGNYLRLSIAGDESWNANFQLPASATTWTPGAYEDLTRYPFQPAGAGALDWSGEGRGCNTLTGRMVVNAVRYDGDAVGAIDLDFVQHCEGAGPALRGHVQWDASAPELSPAPQNPVPTSLWSPPDGAMPASGNAMYFTSAPGDYVGGSYTYWVRALPAGTTPTDPNATATLSLTESGGLLRVMMSGAANWDGEFKAMDSLARVQPGYYGIVQRFPFHNPRRGGMSWSMDSRGCSQLTGWFAVDSISYDGEQLRAVDLRFAQYCDGNPAPLLGRIRWDLGLKVQSARGPSAASISGGGWQ